MGKQNDFVVRHPGKGTLSNVGTENYVGPVTCVGMWLGFMCAGIQTPIYGPMVGDGHQPNSRGLTYTHYKDSLLKVGWVYPQYKQFRPWQPMYFEDHFCLAIGSSDHPAKVSPYEKRSYKSELSHLYIPWCGFYVQDGYLDPKSSWIEISVLGVYQVYIYIPRTQTRPLVLIGILALFWRGWPSKIEFS